MSLHVAMLMTARLLVPAEQRAEWLAEWRAEIWHVERSRDSRAFAFCLGAFKDAFWLRWGGSRCGMRGALNPESPVRCIALLAAVAAAGLLIVFLTPGASSRMSSPFRDARNLMTISADMPMVSVDQYRKLQNQWSGDLAFYQRIAEPVMAPRGAVLMSVVRASGNLFDILNVPLPSPSRMPMVILSKWAWWNYFNHDRRVVGRNIEIAGQRALVAGVIAEDAWPLPGHPDAWLLEDGNDLAVLVPNAMGFVAAHVKPSASLRFRGDSAGIRFAPPPRRINLAFQGFLAMVFVACLVVPVTTPVSSGAYKKDSLRPLLFLLAKIPPILIVLYCYASLASEFGDTPVGLIMILCSWPCSILAFRWVVIDQRRRCPVCLRLLSNPVRFGKASQTFLEWYGTELMCRRGHGALRVTEFQTSCCGAQRWISFPWGFFPRDLPQ